MNLKNKKSTEKINETKSWFFEKINKIDKHLARLTKEKRERTQITNTINERRDITIDLMDIKRIINECYEQLYAHRLDNLDETNQFLDRQFAKTHTIWNRQY